MINDITQTQNISAIMEKLVLNGDLSGLDSKQKVEYYNYFCTSLGLNPATKPFQIIRFQNKEILYATKDATEQLRKIHKVSIVEIDKLFQDGLYIVTIKVQDKEGRYDVATGAVSLVNPDSKTEWVNGRRAEVPHPKAGQKLSGDELANAIMKCESKAKRRATLSICGLGMLDDAETDTIGDYKKVDVTSGELIETKNTLPTMQSPPRVEQKQQSEDVIAKKKAYIAAIKDAPREIDLNEIGKEAGAYAKEINDALFLSELVTEGKAKRAELQSKELQKHAAFIKDLGE